MNEFQYSNLDKNSYFRHLSITQMNSMTILGPVLGEALRRLAGPRDALIHVAAYADLRFHRDALTEWLCGGEWGVRGLRGCLRGQHARLYQGHSSSWLLNAFYASGSVLNPTSPKPCSRHSQTPLTFRAHKI